MDEDLDGLIRRVDPDRWLSSRFIADRQQRADVVTLYAYDHELARAPRVASNALLGEIRLTWWGEAVDEIYGGRPPRRHPTVQALADLVARHGIARDPLEGLIEARYRELDPAPLDAAEALGWAKDTGGAVAVLAAGILAPEAQPDAAGLAGAAWALSRRARTEPALQDAAAHLRQTARGAVRTLPAAAFPAVAHAALAAAGLGEVQRRLTITWAVLRGRI